MVSMIVINNSRPMGRKSKAYKLYNSISKITIINRDVVFDEDNFWLWEEKPNNQQLPLDLDDGDMEQEQPLADEDDLIYAGSDPIFLEKFKVSMMTKFDMSDLGLMHYFLGIEVKQSSSEFFFHKRNMSEKHYRDSDFAGDKEDRKSTSGYVFMLGFGVVSWCSKKQPIVTLSTTEVEFVAQLCVLPKRFG
uniref:Uncharacterized protein n=1 Tax=Solanum lycopersicum TaxID=4081 RepID=A0A3Q7J6A7_SOLLC